MTALVEGVLAGNIFDWGSAACVELYQSGTILDIYRMSRNKLKRPWKASRYSAPRPTPSRAADPCFSACQAVVVVSVL